MKEVTNLFLELVVKQCNISKRGSEKVLEEIKNKLKENNFKKIEVVGIVEEDNNYVVYFERNKKSNEMMVARYRQEGTTLTDLTTSIETI